MNLFVTVTAKITSVPVDPTTGSVTICGKISYE